MACKRRSGRMRVLGAQEVRNRRHDQHRIIYGHSSKRLLVTALSTTPQHRWITLDSNDYRRCLTHLQN